MGSKPKPYKPSAEELALRSAQLEELRSKKSELEAQKVRMAKGSKAGRSLISDDQVKAGAQQTLGAE